MIHLDTDTLAFTFPDVHHAARLHISFQRTLRIPDDDRAYPLPPGLAPFPLRLVDEFLDRVPAAWRTHGGVMLPMYQSEAMWIDFQSFYPFAVKIAAGRINAVTGEPWTEGLHRDPQDYMVSPGQPWLDGYCIRKGEIRQFVAMPLGAGYTAEEQLTGAAEHGGLQILVHPMKAPEFEKWAERWKRSRGGRRLTLHRAGASAAAPTDMGLAPGGRMKQDIHRDRHDLSVWDLEHSARCFVHIANSRVWAEITREAPPTMPPTAREYSLAGLPWFDYYDGDREALEGAERLDGLRSVAHMGAEKGETPLPENDDADPTRVIRLRAGLEPDQVREGSF